MIIKITDFRKIILSGRMTPAMSPQLRDWIQRNFTMVKLSFNHNIFSQRIDWTSCNIYGQNLSQNDLFYAIQ